jgi:hypothetical protein
MMTRPFFDRDAAGITDGECTVEFTGGATMVQRAGLIYRWYRDVLYVNDGEC